MAAKEVKLLLKWGESPDGTVKTKELHCNIEAQTTTALFQAQEVVWVTDVLSTNSADVLDRYPVFEASDLTYNMIPYESIVSVKFLEDPGW